MTILPHADNIQDNGYFCGPATLQVLLGIRGVNESEQQAAVEAHTTVEGTPTVDDIARVLNAHLGAGTYRTVYIGGNDASAEQVAQLRTDIAASIGAGYGVACNVVGTATTADGRERNSYPGGHYLPVTGYDAGADRVWCTDVADGHEYWMTTAALATWIAGRGYATITAATAARSTMEDDMSMTDEVPATGGRNVATVLSDIWNGMVNGHSGFVPSDVHWLDAKVSEIAAGVTAIKQAQSDGAPTGGGAVVPAAVVDTLTAAAKALDAAAAALAGLRAE